MNAQHQTILRIERGAGDEPGHVEEFTVPFSPGDTVLDGLQWIRSHLAPDLAFRFACINANVCKECVMRIDGRNGYACTARLREGSMRLEPLRSKPRIRDLACATVPPKERLG